MKYKIGDKVKFLNQNGGGIVVKILSPQMISVAIEDGFEIPILASEVLKIEITKDASSLFTNKEMFSNVTNTRQQTLEDEETEYERVFPLKKVYNTAAITEGIYLAFIPHEQRWLVTGQVDICLLNYTRYDFVFSLFLRDIETENFLGQDYDVLPKNAKILLSTINREEIPFWSKGVIQGVFHTENSKNVLNPLNAEFKIKEMRFLKEENYKAIPILDEKALVLNLANISDISSFVENKNEILVDKAQKETPSKKGTLVTNNFLDLHKMNTKTAEVDLHIESLTEDADILSPSEILLIQMNYFEKSLNAAIENKLEQITFIHGVGTGKLKTEIIQALKQYNGLHWFDAPMAKYGVGATNVLIGQNVKKQLFKI